jgi:hypothetical protein
VGLRDKLKRMSVSDEELHEGHLQEVCAAMGLTPIDEAPLRAPVRVGGEIQKVQIVPRAGSSSLEVTVADGHGKAVGVFTGRRHIAGLTIGRNVVLEGMSRKERNRLVVLNPVYTLVD